MRLGHPAAPLDATLGALAEVIVELRQADYTVVPPGFHSSIGSQVRHTLDHVTALLTGVREGCIDYDRRARGTVVERRRDEALAALSALRRSLREALDRRLDTECLVIDRLEACGRRTPMKSSFSRELAYVISHTTHHNAIVGAMAEAQGREIPKWFGYAPSTLAHMRVTGPPCAP